jgi:hypothetical protein
MRKPHNELSRMTSALMSASTLGTVDAQRGQRKTQAHRQADEGIGARATPVMKMSPKKIRARERRLAAIHEAGHVVVARRLGFELLSAWITPHGGEPDERTWTGRVQIRRPDEASESGRRMVGIAGSVAEHLWSGGWIEDYSPDEAMSESDWHLAGCDPDDEPDDVLMDAIEDVGRLFTRDGAGWQELLAEARRLIVASRLST